GSGARELALHRAPAAGARVGAAGRNALRIAWADQRDGGRDRSALEVGQLDARIRAPFLARMEAEVEAPAGDRREQARRVDGRRDLHPVADEQRGAGRKDAAADLVELDAQARRRG